MKSRDFKQLDCGHTACYLQNGDQNIVLLTLGQLSPTFLYEVIMYVEYNLAYNISTCTCLLVFKHQFVSIAVRGPVAQWREGQTIGVLSSGPTSTHSLGTWESHCLSESHFSCFRIKSSYFKSPSSYTNLNLLLN